MAAMVVMAAVAATIDAEIEKELSQSIVCSTQGGSSFLLGKYKLLGEYNILDN